MSSWNSGRRIWCFFVLFFFLAGSFFMAGQDSSKIKIVTSIYPFYEFARNVCGERGVVRILLSPGSEVHTWRPKPSDIFELNQADLFLGVGSILEPWLHEVLESIDNPGLRILEADKIVSAVGSEEKEPLHEHTVGSIDPHLWLDFLYDIRIVEEIRDILTVIDPSNATLFSSNADAYIDRLNRLDRQYRETLQSCSTRILLLGGHSAFGYWAKRYNLKQLAVYGANPDAQPSPKQVVEILELARTSGVKAVFYEKAVNPNIAGMIAKEIGALILPLNPAASLTREEMRNEMNFIDVMEKNLENLRIGLSCK